MIVRRRSAPYRREDERSSLRAAPTESAVHNVRTVAPIISFAPAWSSGRVETRASRDFVSWRRSATNSARSNASQIISAPIGRLSTFVLPRPSRVGTVTAGLDSQGHALQTFELPPGTKVGVVFLTTTVCRKHDAVRNLRVLSDTRQSLNSFVVSISQIRLGQHRIRRRARLLGLPSSRPACSRSRLLCGSPEPNFRSCATDGAN